MAGIYIHIPFCKQACHYCDFHFSTNTGRMPDMVSALGRELLLRRQYLENEEIKTIYFGGGTPSMLTADQARSIFESLKKNYNVSADAEITLEANPDDLTREKIRMFRDLGVNRLSIGIQSFDDNVLEYFNRPHNASDSRACIALAREEGFKNISVDLIYAIPKLTDEAWRYNIEQAIALDVKHISAYSLTIEQKTAFGNWFAKGKLVPVKDDDAAYQLEILVETLASSGFEQYEVSNFCKAGFQSRHNSSYWRQEKYSGIGPSAHSYNGDTRQFNVRNNTAYIKAITRDEIPCEIEVLTREDKVNEYLLTTLRTSWGSDLNFLKQQLDYNIEREHGNYISTLVENKFAVIENHFLKLTRAGRMLADKISSDLFLTRDTF
jgi:oxygen-independent coproporphyrinogen III oxidase